MLDRICNFILNSLTENENTQRLSRAIVLEMQQWIRTHFLENDLKMETRLCDISKSVDYKKGLIEMKLETLQEDNPNFNAALEIQVLKFEKALQSIDNQLFERSISNAILNSTISSGGNIQLGDTTNHSTTIQGNQVQGNHIERQTTLEAGATYVEKAQGDGNVIGNNSGNRTIINHYYSNPKPITTPSTKAPSLSTNPLDLIQENRLEEAMLQLRNSINASEDYKYLQMEITMLAARFARLKNEEDQGIIASQDANLERNRITKSLLALSEKLDNS
jgi:hypothetical protein